MQEELAKCKTDPARFNETILCRGPYWSKQREICRSLVEHPITCVKTGNGVGKSFVASGIINWFATLHPNSKTMVAAPTVQQLANVVWAETIEARRNAKRQGIDLGGKEKGLSITFGPNWIVEGMGQGSVESKSGRHAADLLAVIDEASGVSQTVHEGVDSTNPSRRLYTGNPIKPEGKFFELCESSGRNPNVNVIEISSLDSPHAHLERSPWGMADKGFLDNARFEYGEDSLWWLVHVLGKFPTELQQALLPMEWLKLAADLIRPRRGPMRIGVDLAKGNDGDPAGIVVRDDLAVRHYEESNRWDLEATAKHTKRIALEYGVEPGRITYDATNLGTDFGNRLAAVGITGAIGYMGSRDGGEKYGNLRTAAGWEFRRRLDPNRVIVANDPESPHAPKIFIPQEPFGIPKHLVDRFRAELQGCRYELDNAGRIHIEVKDVFKARLKRSPTFLDCLFMSFAYPHA